MKMEVVKEIMLEMFSKMEEQFTEVAEFGYTGWRV
jgi:hypothetical protein